MQNEVKDQSAVEKMAKKVPGTFCFWSACKTWFYAVYSL